MVIERKLIVSSAYYDEARRAIVVNGEIDLKQVQVPMPEEVWTFRDGMDHEEEMRKLAGLLNGRRGIAITVQSPEK
jgi:hypothetical protein